MDHRDLGGQQPKDDDQSPVNTTNVGRQETRNECECKWNLIDEKGGLRTYSETLTR